MITGEFLGTIHCPYCGSSLELRQATAGSSGIETGVVRCACYEYPIVEGILILRQGDLPIGGDIGAVASLVGQGRAQDALLHAFHLTYDNFARQRRLAALASRMQEFCARAKHRVERRQVRQSLHRQDLSFIDTLSILRPSYYAQYLYYRHANPSFLSAVASLLMLQQCLQSQISSCGPRVLDLACGAGHCSYLMNVLLPQAQVIAADHDFVSLYLAKRFFIPNTPCICLDAQAPMPFDSRFFDSIFCLDAFHYIRSKAALLRELQRVARPQALWLFPHLHNAAGRNPVAGSPLDAANYRRLFEPLGRPRLLGEARMLRQFVREGTVDIDPSRPVEAAGENAFCLIAGNHPGLERKFGDMGIGLLQAPLSVNPIYHARCEGNSMQLDLRWPSRPLEKECGLANELLPSSCQVDLDLLRRLSLERIEAADLQQLSELARQFVLVNLPRHYASPPSGAAS